MAKYIVESGNLTTTVDAETHEKAALWAIHQAMRQVLPIDDCDSPVCTAVTSDRRIDSPEPARALGSIVEVRREGQRAEQTHSLETMDVVRQWNEMFAALARLQRLLDQSGLAA